MNVFKEKFECVKPDVLISYIKNIQYIKNDLKEDDKKILESIKIKNNNLLEVNVDFLKNKDVVSLDATDIIKITKLYKKYFSKNSSFLSRTKKAFSNAASSAKNRISKMPSLFNKKDKKTEATGGKYKKNKKTRKIRRR